MIRVLQWIFVILAAIVLMILGAWRVEQALVRRSAAAARTLGEGPALVVVSRVEPRDLSGALQLTGTLRPENLVDVTADVPGRVVELRARVGDRVAKGDLLARLEDTDLALGLAQAEGALAAAQASRDAAATDAAAAEKLAASDAMTRTQLSGARSRLAAAEGQVKQATAARDAARERRRDAEIRAPIAGIVSVAGTDVGRLVSPGVPVFQLLDDSAWEVEVGLDEAAAYAVTPGLPAEVRSDAQAGSAWIGRVETVAPVLDPRTRKAAAVIHLDPSDTRAIANSTVSVRVALSPRPGALTVPEGALVERGGEPYVRIVLDNTVKSVPVRLGLREGGRVEVSGVDAGAAVITAGPLDLADGAAVTVAEG